MKLQSLATSFWSIVGVAVVVVDAGILDVFRSSSSSTGAKPSAAASNDNEDAHGQGRRQQQAATVVTVGGGKDTGGTWLPSRRDATLVNSHRGRQQQQHRLLLDDGTNATTTTAATTTTTTAPASNGTTAANATSEEPPYRSSHGDDVLLPSVPMQVYAIPLPETALYDDVFQPLFNISATTAPGSKTVTSLVSITISTDGTVIWYDHWEDGFERDVMKDGSVKSAHTEVWGDGDATNGCRPDIMVICADGDDVFTAGDSLVIESRLVVPRTAANWFGTTSTGGMRPDAGDRLYANAPLTIVRSAHAFGRPVGATEVLPESKWGTDYELPVAESSEDDDGDASTGNAHFAMVRAFVMSNTDGNEITLPDGIKAVLNQGQGLNFAVPKVGKRIHADYPVQVHLLTAGSRDSLTMRWYALLPHDQWSDSYLVPYGDARGSTRLLLYNPSARVVTARITTIHHEQMVTETLSVRPGASILSGPVLATAAIKSTGLLSILSATNLTLTNNHTIPSMEWGYSVIPRNQLASQAQVGWGYSCLNNFDGSASCTGLSQSAAVWVSGERDADLYVDEDNSGTSVLLYKMAQLHAIKLQVPPGSLLFATEPDSGIHGPPVRFAAAWGQDPAATSDSAELNLGTAVLPLPPLQYHLQVDQDVIVPGEPVRYILTIANYGQSDLDDVVVHAQLPAMGAIVPGSLKYSADGGVSFAKIDDVTPDAAAIADPTTDAATATAAAVPALVSPLTLTGGFPMRTLARRGGTHVIKFDVTVQTALVDADKFLLTGSIKSTANVQNLVFKKSLPLKFEADISLVNKVYLGSMGTAGCGPATDAVSAVEAAIITYCFTLKNEGSTYLNAFLFDNEELDVVDAATQVQVLAPGASTTLTIKSTITGNITNYARIEATPVLADGVTTIKGMNKVAAVDSSTVTAEPPQPAMDVVNTVFKGISDAKFCAVQGSDIVSGREGENITYCFQITNRGNTLLTNLHVTNILLEYNNADLIDLPPNATTIVAVASNIGRIETNKVTVTGVPANAVGVPYPNMTALVSTDSSQVLMDDDAAATAAVDLKPTGCLDDAWKDGGNTIDLVCRAKEVYIDAWVNTPRMSCRAGEIITVNLTASIHVASQRYDLGWYVAGSGGDGLHGTCHAATLRQGIDYIVTAGKEDPTVAGYVSWNEDKDSDTCGDVMFPDGAGGGNIVVPVLQNQQIKCLDGNHNAVADVNVCFTWRSTDRDGLCSIDRSDSLGREIDLYPGLPTKCFCALVDIDTITVTTPETKQYANPC